MNLEITVKEGGERLYVYPFCSKPDETKVIFPPIQEFAPDGDCWNFLNNSCRSELGWVKFKYNTIRIIQSVRYAVKSLYLNLKYRYLNGLMDEFFRNVKIYFELSPPVLGAEFYESVFSIKNQLQVDDPNFYTDTAYLKPSQEYLRLKLEELLKNYLDGKDKYGDVNSNEWAAENIVFAQNYINWRDSKLKEGYEIKFLFSLDT
jgi:hypothetical protein